jgi:muconolactone delta-isomerase
VQFMVTSRRRIEQYGDADFAPLIPGETARVKELYAEGVVRHIWLRADGLGACFIVEAEDLGSAREIVDDLPIARAGLSEFTVLALRPYGGFTR